MTDKRIEKAMAEDLMSQFGAMVSVSDVVKYTGYGWKKVSALLVGCKAFGAGTGRSGTTPLLKTTAARAAWSIRGAFCRGLV